MHACPACGYCPHCGRGGPIKTVPYPQPPYPFTPRPAPWPNTIPGPRWYDPTWTSPTPIGRAPMPGDPLRVTC